MKSTRLEIPVERVVWPRPQTTILQIDWTKQKKRATMGNSLQSPITDKDTSVGSNDEAIKSCNITTTNPLRLEYGTSSMQGWRTHMEDAHICQPNLLPNLPDHALFAVFDGHGGSFTSKYAAEHFGRLLQETPAFEQYRKRVAPSASVTRPSSSKRNDHNKKSDNDKRMKRKCKSKMLCERMNQNKKL